MSEITALFCWHVSFLFALIFSDETTIEQMLEAEHNASGNNDAVPDKKACSVAAVQDEHVLLLRVVRTQRAILQGSE